MLILQQHPSEPSKKVTVTLPEGEVLGINVTELQDNIQIQENKLIGTSKYVESFPKFSRNAKGNFLAIKCDEATKGDTVSWELSEAKTKGKGTFDEDGILVVQLHSNTQKITLKNGETNKVLDLTGLTLSPSE